MSMYNRLYTSLYVYKCVTIGLSDNFTTSDSTLGKDNAVVPTVLL